MKEYYVNYDEFYPFCYFEKENRYNTKIKLPKNLKEQFDKIIRLHKAFNDFIIKKIQKRENYEL